MMEKPNDPHSRCNGEGHIMMRSAEYQRGYDAGYKQALLDALHRPEKKAAGGESPFKPRGGRSTMAHDNLRERLLSTKPDQPGWWMVERDDGETRPLYLTMPGGAGGWSSDWREGFKFQEREHAEQQVELWHRDYGHARSHGMMVEFVNPDGPEAADRIKKLEAAMQMWVAPWEPTHWQPLPSPPDTGTPK